MTLGAISGRKYATHSSSQAVSLQPGYRVTNQKKFFNDEEALEFMRSSLASAEKPWVRRWAILLRPSPESSDNTSANIEDRDSKPRMIGLVGIVRPAEIGYKIHPDFWGKGYMSEALELCIKLFWASKGL
jgi:RimJ/RimL family protein N-acetyltransferase